MNGSESFRDVVLSYGDLSHSSGYRTRVLGELEHLDQNPYLLLFDRDPERFEREARINQPFRAVPRSSVFRFYLEVARLARQKPIRLVHAHNLYSAALALSARRLHNYRVILDYHGRIPEEYVFLGKGRETSKRALERLEEWTVRKADHVVVVSQQLADYLASRYGVAKERITVIPCATNSTLFRWDPSLRSQTRLRLGLEGRFVCIHLGSFFEWYEPELLVRAFGEIRDAVQGAMLLVVSADTDKVSEYLASRLPPGSFSVISARHHDVPAYLNAADLGFLLLRSTPNIQTSSPVKFAEYLNCGLPVLITPQVGDYSELIEQGAAGIVMEPGKPVSLERLKDTREQLAARCVSAGKPLTWQALGNKWQNAIDRACGSVALKR